jgi:hypothetical protein
MASSQMYMPTTEFITMGALATLEAPFVRRQSTHHQWPAEVENDVDGYVERVFDYYRRDGFPVYSLNSQQKLKRLKSLLKSATKSRVTKGVVSQNMSGLSLAWNYFPHAWDVRCGSMITPKEVFFDDELFHKAIHKQLKHSSYISHVSVRKSLRFLSGAQGVSNFRPTAAAALYRRFLPASGGVVWDMSAGFGGRLLGAIACPRVKKYIGTDPAKVTMAGLREMRDELVPMARTLGRSPLEVELHQCGSEDFVPEPSSLELCLTSPPYMGHEKYSAELTQSYLRFPTKEAWLNCFLGGTLRNCHIGLKPEGKLVVNLANVPTYPELERDFVTLAENNGWKLVSTLRLALSKMMGTRNGGGKHKFEFIFVFEKT